MALGGRDIKKKLTEASKAAKKLLSAYMREGEIDYSKPYKKLTDAQKKLLDTTDCPDYAVENLSPVTLKRIKITGDNFITGSELIDATSESLRRMHQSSADLETIAGRSKSFLSVMNTVSNSLTRGDMFSSYPYKLQQQVLEFGKITKEINQILENQKNNTALSLDEKELSDFIGELKSTFSFYKEAIDSQTRLGLTQGSKNVKEEAKYATQVEYSLTKKMNSLQKGLDSLRKASSISENIGRNADRYGRNANYDGRAFVSGIEELTSSIRRRDYVNFAKKIFSMMKFRKNSKKKKQAKENDATKEYLKALGGMAFNTFGLSALTMLLKMGKQVLGHLFGVNDIAADFNQKMVEAHGLTSMNITGDVNFTPEKNFSELRDKFFSFGAETRSFITPEDYLNLTKAYEKEGIKLRELLSNTEETKSMMNLTLNYSINLGISMEELASYQADWKRNLGMDAKQMGAVLQVINKNYAESGLNAHTYIDAIQTATYDFGIWNNSIISLLDIQHKILTKKDLTVDAAKKTADALNNHIQNMSATQWDILASKLPGDEIAKFLARDQARLQKNLDESSDPVERSKSAYAIERISRARINPDPAYSRLLFREIGSLESKYELLQKSLKSVFGDEVKGEIDRGLYSQSMNYRMKALIGFSGSPDEWESMKYGLSTILDPDVDFSELAKKSDEAAKKVDPKPMKALGETEAAAYVHQATYQEIFESMIKQYVNKYISICESIANYLLKFINFLSGGGGQNFDPKIREESLEKIKEILDKISKEKDPKKKQALIQQLYDPCLLYMQNGGDASSVKDFAKNLKLGKETMTALDQWLVPPQPMGMPGMAAGTSTSLSAGWVSYITKVNPSRATEIINALNTNSVRTGIPADYMAGKLMQESGFNTAATSYVGAMGIAQFMPQTAAGMGLTRHEAYNDVMKAISKSFDLDIQNRNMLAKAIPNWNNWSTIDKQRAIWSAYNGGAGGFISAYKRAKSSLGREPANWAEVAPRLPKETANYAPSIEKHMSKYGAGGGGGPAMPYIPLPAPPPKVDAPKTKTPLSKNVEKQPKRTPPPRDNTKQRRRVTRAKSKLESASAAVKQANKPLKGGKGKLKTKKGPP